MIDRRLETMEGRMGDAGATDVVWHAVVNAQIARHVLVHDELRYAQGASQADVELDGFLNYHWLMSPAELERPKVMLEAGVNPRAEVVASDGSCRPLIAIRSSPWKGGHESNPRHDEFDLDHGHVRYFGDHKPSTVGLPGATKGNKLLLDATRLHSRTIRAERLHAPPLLLSRAITIRRGGAARVPGHVEPRNFNPLGADPRLNRAEGDEGGCYP
jgi:hypothetical protein